MTKPFFSDDLSDLLGGDDAPAAPAQPQGEGWDRIRSYAGQAPAAKVFEVSCPKCNGSGTWRGAYKTGPCFSCKGTGKLERKTAPATLARAKERRVEQKDAVRAEAAPQIAWLQGKLAQNGLPEGYAKMLGEFLTRLQAGLPLSGDAESGQMGVIAKGMKRDAEYAAKRQERAVERVQAAPGVDASMILEAFQKARASGLKYVSLRLQGLMITEAQKHPGTLYIKGNPGGAYLGKAVDGRFVQSRECNPETSVKILEVLADPAAAAKTYGLETGECSCCGRKLTNKLSIELGIGPICRDRFGF